MFQSIFFIIGRRSLNIFYTYVACAITFTTLINTFKCKTDRINSLTHKISWTLVQEIIILLACVFHYIIIVIFLFQTLDFDRDGLTKLKKAIKAIHNSGNGESSVIVNFRYTWFYDCAKTIGYLLKNEIDSHHRT